MMSRSLEGIILNHLKSGKSISQAEAINLCDCFRLSAVIHTLRRDGHKIEKVWEPNVKHKGVHARYYYVKDSEA